MIWRGLSFFSEMIIIFFAFFFNIFKLKKFDKVSVVVPDLEIIINKIFFNFSFF